LSTSTSQAQVKPSRRPLRRSDLTVHELDGEALVFDAASGDTHRLNSTALFIWNECDGLKVACQIAERLAEVYEVSPDSAVLHVEGIWNEFDGRHLFVDSADWVPGGDDA
jgi:hypothetical protein